MPYIFLKFVVNHFLLFLHFSALLNLTVVFCLSLKHYSFQNKLQSAGEESSQQTFVLMKTSSRRLDEDEYVLINHTSSEDVFKTSSRRLGQDQYIRLGYTSSRRFQDVFKTSCKNVFKTSSKLANTS